MTTTTPHAQTAQPAVSARNLSKTYGMGEATVHALNNVSVDFEQGKFTAIMGPSGSGKSTLMQTIATLDTPDPNPATSIRIGGTELFGLKDNALTEFRREHIGFIFQAFNLVPTLTAGQNIDLPLGLAGKKPDPQWRDYLVKTLGLETRLDHRPEQLSGGQQQRVAIVRALLAAPKWSSPTNRPVTSTPTPAPRCCACYVPPQPTTHRPSSWSPTTQTPPPTQTAWSSSRTAWSPAK